jgi:hypothetical protein
VLASDGPAPAVPLPILADYVAGAFLSLLRWWLEHQRPYTPEQMHAIFQQVVLPGVEAVVPPGDEGEVVRLNARWTRRHRDGSPVVVREAPPGR